MDKRDQFGLDEGGQFELDERGQDGLDFPCTHQIPYYRPNGKQIYFDRSEVEAWMKQNRVATIKETEQQAIAYVVAGKKGGNL